MQLAGLNYLAVLVAAIAGFGFGAAWYTVLARTWMAAVGFTEQPKPSPGIFIIAFICQLVMAWVLAGVIGHLGDVTVSRSVISALFLWLGLVATTVTINHRFQNASWSLTVIDAGHWLGVLFGHGGGHRPVRRLTDIKRGTDQSSICFIWTSDGASA